MWLLNEAPGPFSQLNIRLRCWVLAGMVEEKGRDDWHDEDDVDGVERERMGNDEEEEVEEGEEVMFRRRELETRWLCIRGGIVKLGLRVMTKGDARERRKGIQLRWIDAVEDGERERGVCV